MNETVRNYVLRKDTEIAMSSIWLEISLKVKGDDFIARRDWISWSVNGQ